VVEKDPLAKKNYSGSPPRKKKSLHQPKKTPLLRRKELKWKILSRLFKARKQRI
jgi:hypothetical protein